MLLTLLSWCYIGVTSFLWGFGIIRLLRGRNSEKWEGADTYLLSGLCAITVYAQTFSLFAGVGMAANLFMIFICIMIVFWCHRQIKVYIQKLCQNLKESYVLLRHLSAYADKCRKKIFGSAKTARKWQAVAGRHRAGRCTVRS